MLEKLVYLLILISLFFGIIPNALVYKHFGLQIPFYLFDISILFAFIIIAFLPRLQNDLHKDHCVSVGCPAKRSEVGLKGGSQTSCTYLTSGRIKSVDLTILFTAFYLFILNVVNLKLLFIPSSILYLVRFTVLALSYPFFIYVFKKYKNFSVKSLNLFLLLCMLFYLIVFAIFPNVTLAGFDPHVKRLYGMFIDPNFYSVFACLVFFYSLVSKSMGIVLKSSLIFLSLVSIFLTFSRLGLLVFLFTLIVMFLKNKSPFIIGLFTGFLILVLTNISYLYRILFVGGNLDSFIYKIISFVEGLYLINLQPIPVGFNNITVYRYFLMSNVNNVTSFFDFSPFTFILSGGIIFAAVFSLLIIYLTRLNSSSKLLIFLFVLSGFVMNTTFNPMLIVTLLLLVVNSCVIDKVSANGK